MRRGVFQMKTKKFLALAASLCTAFLIVFSPLPDMTGEEPDLEVEAAGASAQAAAPEIQAEVLENQAVPAAGFDYSQVPAWDGVPYYRVNQDVPFFTAADLSQAAVSFKKFSPVDSLGRTGTAVESVGPDLLPTEKRGSIGMIKPSGWQTPQSKFDFIDGNYVYNRCHELAYSLSGENANPQNLMTGTRYFNVDGMEPYELSILGYVQKTGNHVLYRATPIFVGNELEARGILLEAESVEDGGKGIRFNAFIYNVQPGVVIDYATGAVAAGDSQADRALAIQNYASTVLYDEYGNVSQMHSHGGKSKSAAAGSRAGAADASKGKGVSAAAGTATAAANAAGGTGQASAESGAAVGSAEDGKEITYVVNTNTGKFHRPGCSSVSQMKQKNRLDTTESRDQLIAEGQLISCI